MSGGWVILVMLRWEDSSWVAEDPGASMSREELSTSVYVFTVVCCLLLTMDAAVINTPSNALTSLPL